MSRILSTGGGGGDGVYLWVQVGVHSLGRHTSPWADTPSRDGHCSERYASYWNAFSLLLFINYATAFQLHVSAGMSVQGGHTPIKAKKNSCVFKHFPSVFFRPQNKTFRPILLPLPIERYTTTNIYYKPQYQIQQSLLQKLHSIIELSPTSKPK